MLNILITNDDGILAPGILALRDALKTIAHVTVIAPEVDGSGFSSSLSLNNPIRIHELDDNFFALRGTPADCIHLALSGFLSFTPDIVISGINNRSNLGDDIIYSGTVAAAYEGRYLTYPSLALSMVSESKSPNYDTGSQVCIKLIEQMISKSYRHYGVMNVNVPDVPYEKLKGYRITKIGRRGLSQPVQKGFDPRGNEYFWMGARGNPLNAEDEQTDFNAIHQGFVSISPLSLEYTDYEHFDRMKSLFL
jgi:5'-nucleotidase